MTELQSITGGSRGAVMVCLCAMHDPAAHTLVPADHTVMRQGYLILHKASHHVVLEVAYSGPVGRPLSMDPPAHGSSVEWWAEAAAGKWAIVCHPVNIGYFPIGMGTIVCHASICIFRICICIWIMYTHIHTHVHIHTHT